MKIVVTGFDPFNRETVNPAQLIVEQLPSIIKDATIVPLIIPTIAYQSLEMIEKELEKGDVDVVISLGQAGGRSKISLERVAINLNDFSIKDNGDNQYIDEPIFPDGQTAYFTTLPIKRIKKELENQGYPIEISNTAGTFVCNHVFYGVAHIAKAKYPTIKTGFIHIPYTCEQVEDRPHLPSLKLEEMVNAVVRAIEVIVDSLDDEKIQTEGGLN